MRHSPRPTEAARDWASFVAANAAVVAEAGLPALATESYTPTGLGSQEQDLMRAKHGG